jgi:hypothetical protein
MGGELALRTGQACVGADDGERFGVCFGQDFLLGQP